MCLKYSVHTAFCWTYAKHFVPWFWKVQASPNIHTLNTFAFRQLHRFGARFWASTSLRRIGGIPWHHWPQETCIATTSTSGPWTDTANRTGRGRHRGQSEEYLSCNGWNWWWSPMKHSNGWHANAFSYSKNACGMFDFGYDANMKNTLDQNNEGLCMLHDQWCKAQVVRCKFWDTLIYTHRKRKTESRFANV